MAPHMEIPLESFLFYKMLKEKDKNKTKKDQTRF